MIQKKAILQTLPKPFKQSAKKILKFPLMLKTRAELLMSGVEPLANTWNQRGESIHRTYLEQFLQEFSKDIKGHCLEFQEDSYTSRFGRTQVTKLDILHKETDNPKATIVADLTQPNDVPSNTFDCIICTYTLHVIPDLDYMVGELHRILKPSGVLLVAVPDITRNYPQYNELWRFTAKGLHLLLAKSFGDENVTVKTYGNSMTAAGELRGMTVEDFTTAQLNYHDPRYALVVCARCVKKSENLS
ncbi:methyltransferase domain-containing protein [Brasilonema sp. UFV-L1]|uniref:methyltransferase domain-containing protein n=1 Tax=Brasilonema sp. UFV-L1 TaxID=2234130 RepID=UPI00145CCDA4|nr:methyltransferase domain-containing protein [Brasilonema sp. UFV-L1]NMG11222.1 methyltransferase [Brasilonema sp. UFV-L1]